MTIVKVYNILIMLDDRAISEDNGVNLKMCE